LPIEDLEKVETLRKEVGLEPLSDATRRIQERHNITVANRRENRATISLTRLDKILFELPNVLL